MAISKRKILELSLGFFLIFLFPLLIRALDRAGADVSYPIPELGNCASREECKVFCDQPDNYVVCAQWAAENGLMPEENVKKVERDAQRDKEFKSGRISEGPGGCRTPEECDLYCSKPEHSEECFKFGVEHNLISPEEAARIQKEVLESKGPGGCKANEECDLYCSKPENFEECVNYGIKEGTLTPEEARVLLEITKKEEKMRSRRPMEEGPQFKPKGPEINAEKAEEVLKNQKGPGGCSSIEECKKYCEDMAHIEECLSFAEENGLMPKEELKKAKSLMKEKGPGGCQGPKECDEYCSLPKHQEECLEFAQKHNLISPEEAELMKKVAGGGPGGCRTPEECDAYCRLPEHMEECLMFSVKQGMMSEEDAQRMMEIIKKQEERSLKLRGAPPQEGPSLPHMFEKGMPMENEWPGSGSEGSQPPFQEFGPSREVKPPFPESMPFQNEEVGPQPKEVPEAGPGGCQSQEECDLYCSKPEHREECSKFSPRGEEELPSFQPNQFDNQNNQMIIPQGEGQIPPEDKYQLPPEGEKWIPSEFAPPEKEPPFIPENSTSSETPQSFLFAPLKDFLAGVKNLIKF